MSKKKDQNFKHLESEIWDTQKRKPIKSEDQPQIGHIKINDQAYQP